MAAGAVELEVKTSIVELIAWRDGAVAEAVRVDYRPAGARAWQHFNLIPEPGQTIEALERRAPLAAQMVHAGRAIVAIDERELDQVDDVDDGPAAA